MELDDVIADLAPRLLAFCRGSFRDPDLAADAAQEALAALVDRWRRLGPPESPSAFVFAVARRRAGRWFGRRRAEESLDGLAERAEAEPPIDETLAIREEFAAMTAALARLRRRDREALLLVAVAELPHAEAARIAATSVGAFKMRLSRARRRLAALLEGDR